MFGDKVKIILSLSPALLVIILLFFGGIFYGLLQSLGYQPAIGKYEINLDAYYNVMFAERYSKLGKQVKLRHLTKDCHSLLRKTGQLIVDSDDDPDYGIAVDYGVKLGIFGK